MSIDKVYPDANDLPGIKKELEKEFPEFACNISIYIKEIDKQFQILLNVLQELEMRLTTIEAMLDV